MKNETDVLIADDHPIFRQGLRQVIESTAELKIVCEAEDGRAALEGIEMHQPEVAVLDVDMPLMDGVAVARAVRDRKLNVKLIFLTMHKDEDLFNEAVDLGVRGYVLKDSAVTDIAASVRAVAAGENFISPALSTYLFKRGSRADALREQKPTLKDLTPTEHRILSLVAANKTSREIADELFVSPRTVENHRANICTKLDLRGAHSLLKFALEHRSELS